MAPPRSGNRNIRRFQSTAIASTWCSGRSENCWSPNPLFVSDATAAFDRTGPDGVAWPAATIHAVTMANLQDEFAEIATTEEVLARLEQGLRLRR